MDDHLASIWEAIADERGGAVALQHGELLRTWRDFDDRSARLASALLAAGIGPGDTVAIDLYNCSEYFEVFLAALKIRAVPANVNYRYGHRELVDLLQRSDARVLVYHGSLAERVMPAAREIGDALVLVRVDDSGAEPAIANGHSDLEVLIAEHSPAPRVHRPETDVYLSFTGGTTGLPKGVEYLIGPSVRNTHLLGRTNLGLEDIDWEAPVIERVRTLAAQNRRPVAVPASPLMHSTGLIMASLPVLTLGGTVVTLTSRSFDADVLLSVVAATRANTMSIVGDVMARPIAAALDLAAARGKPYDTSSLATITSAGVAWSGPVKEAILRHIPQVTLVDACGSSEGVTIGMMTTRRGDDAYSDRFWPAPGIRLFRDDGTEIPAGSEEVGRFIGPTVARGYRGDPVATAKTFRPLDGVRHAVPGDHGRWNPDGTLTLLGRGSSVINTGGEKVFAEEVQQVIAQLEGVDDCAVVGVPDERFGSAVAALVQRSAESDLTAEAVVLAVRSELAGYKVPRVMCFGAVPRGANGKLLLPEVQATIQSVVTE
jgi:fatty-acyl-CoA synthase